MEKENKAKMHIAKYVMSVQEAPEFSHKNKYYEDGLNVLKGNGGLNSSIVLPLTFKCLDDFLKISPVLEEAEITLKMPPPQARTILSFLTMAYADRLFMKHIDLLREKTKLSNETIAVMRASLTKSVALTLAGLTVMTDLREGRITTQEEFTNAYNKYFRLFYTRCLAYDIFMGYLLDTNTLDPLKKIGVEIPKGVANYYLSMYYLAKNFNATYLKWENDVVNYLSKTNLKAYLEEATKPLTNAMPQQLYFFEDLKHRTFLQIKLLGQLETGMFIKIDSKGQMSFYPALMYAYDLMENLRKTDDYFIIGGVVWMWAEADRTFEMLAEDLGKRGKFPETSDDVWNVLDNIKPPLVEGILEGKLNNVRRVGVKGLSYISALSLIGAESRIGIKVNPETLTVYILSAINDSKIKSLPIDEKKGNIAYCLCRFYQFTLQNMFFLSKSVPFIVKSEEAFGVLEKFYGLEKDFSEKKVEKWWGKMFGTKKVDVEFDKFVKTFPTTPLGEYVRFLLTHGTSVAYKKNAPYKVIEPEVLRTMEQDLETLYTGINGLYKYFYENYEKRFLEAGRSLKEGLQIGEPLPLLQVFLATYTPTVLLIKSHFKEIMDIHKDVVELELKPYGGDAYREGELRMKLQEESCIKTLEKLKTFGENFAFTSQSIAESRTKGNLSYM
ncbi:MAG: hypothetical protein NDF55_08925 [archaeon GB-1867-005]|nr:hypothetical protein [Candidatus Culexmicrobium cathedralense]